MRFSLLDLLIAIAIAIVSAASLVLNLLVPMNSAASSYLLHVPCALVVYLLVSSPLYRLFHLYPLLLPKCPSCGDRNRHYYCFRPGWSDEIIECASCRQPIELCCDSTKSRTIPGNWPRFELLWPYSFGGRWRRVS